MAFFVITGGSGRIGGALAPRLVDDGHRVRTLDTREAPDGATWEHVIAGIEQVDALVPHFEAADIVVHLAGHPTERAWHDILSVNIDGTRNVLEAARLAGVPRVLLASSIHAVGFETPAVVRDTPVVVPRPDTYYGVSKAAMEALGSLYADRFGMTVVSARICTFGERPSKARDSATWFSPGDATRLVEAVAALDRPGHTIVWGVSANRPGWFSTRAGESIGFVAQDDAVASLERDGALVEVPGDDVLLGDSFADADHPVGQEW